MSEPLTKIDKEMDQTKERFRMIFDNAFELMGYLTTEGIVLEINRTALNADHTTPEQVIGRPLWEKPSIAWSTANQERLKAAIGRVAAGEFVRYDGKIQVFDPITGDIVYRTSDFSLRPVRDNEGSIIGILAEGRDISDKVRLQEALAESERRLARAQAVAHIGAWEFDVATGKVSGSDETFRLLEYDITEGLPDLVTLRRNYHPDDIPNHAVAVNTALGQGRAYEIEFRVLRKDGTIRWLHSHGIPICDAEGTIERVFGTLQDITERKEAEEQLRLSEERFRAIVEATSSITWQCHPDSMHEVQVPEWRAFTGQTAEEEANGGWMNTIHPEDLPAAREAIIKSFASHTTNSIDYRIRRYDGVYRWFRNIGVPLFHPDGTLREWMGTSIDITEEKEVEFERSRREAETKRILDLLPQIAMKLGPDAIAIYYNQRFYEYLGLPIDTIVSAIHWNPYVHPDDIPVMEKIDSELPQKREPFEYELRLRRYDGEYRWHLFRLIPILTLDGRAVEYLVGSGTDITLHKEREVIQEKRERELREVVDLMPQIAYAVKADATVVYFNRRFYNYTGIPLHVRPGEIDWTKLVFPEDLDLMFQLAKLLPTRREPYEYEIRVRNHEGQYRWHRFRSIVIMADNGEAVDHIISTGSDITEEKARLAEYERLRLEAEEKAITDSLTGLNNHRTFYSCLEEKARLLLNSGGQMAVVMMDMDNFTFLNDTYGMKAGDDILCQVADVLRANCRPIDFVARMGGDEFALLVAISETEQVHVVTDRLREKLQNLFISIVGERRPIPLRSSMGICLFPSETQNFREAVYLANRRCLLDKGSDYDFETEYYRQSLVETSESFAMLNSLIAAIDNKDSYTMRHSADVMRYALWIAEDMGLAGEELERLKVASLLHDVGKIGIPFRLLRTPGRLTMEELRIVQRHTTIGAMLVGSIPELAYAQNVVKCHHERWDGGGYPTGLRGDEIPLVARIVAVADGFSAMTTDRSYRKGMPMAEAMEILEAGSGTQWDASCVAVMLNRLRKEILTGGVRQRFTGYLPGK